MPVVLGLTCSHCFHSQEQPTIQSVDPPVPPHTAMLPLILRSLTMCICPACYLAYMRVFLNGRRPFNMLIS